MNRRHFLYGVATGASALALWQFRPDAAEAAYPYRLTDAQWRSRLSPWAYKVLRHCASVRR
jgi:peptide-methionine (R)-S-oxide reductase